jgi:hypothetical protein
MSLPPPLPRQKQLGDDAGVRLLLPVGRSGWAIAAGYMGLFALLVLPAPIALVLAFLGYRDIKKSSSSPHPKHGMGRVVFAFITGGLGTLFLLGLIVMGLLPKH